MLVAWESHGRRIEFDPTTNVVAVSGRGVEPDGSTFAPSDYGGAFVVVTPAMCREARGGELIVPSRARHDKGTNAGKPLSRFVLSPVTAVAPTGEPL